MDPDVNIISKEETDDGWEFIVEIKEGATQTQHTVGLDEEYFEQFSFDAPDEMVLASFLFLLDNEKPEEILPAFNLHVIGDFFPEYEEQVENYV